MRTRPFKLVNRTELEILRDRLQQEVGRWAAEWLSGENHVQVTITADVDAETVDSMEWRARQRQDGAGVAVGVVAGDLSLRRRLTGLAAELPIDTGDPVLRALDDAATEALLAVLLGTADGKHVGLPPPAEYRARGSSYVFSHCRIGDALELRLVLWPHIVRAWLDLKTSGSVGHDQSMLSRLDALDSQTVAVEVVVGEAEIVFDEFRALAEGVVIKLDRRLDQPLRVRLAGDGVLCAGHLGLSGDRRAVQITTTN